MKHSNSDSRSHRLLRLAAALLAPLLAPGTAVGVILDGTNQCTVKLVDGTDVVLYGEFVSKLRGAGENGKSCVRTKGTEPEEEEMLPALSLYRHLPEWDGKETKAREVPSESPVTTRAGGFREHVKSPCYYYLPPGNSLRLSTREDGTPEFLFVKYTTDETEAAGGVQGGLLHFLMEWSLSRLQERDLRTKVAKECRASGEDGVLVGAVELSEGDEDKGSFRIISGTLSDKGFTRSMVQSGHAPILPGGKVAAAANMTSQGAALFLSTVENTKSIADLSVELDFSYVVQLPAAKGEVIFHWDRFQSAFESYEAEYKSANKSKGKGGDDDVLTVSEDEFSQFYDTLTENSVVEFVFEGYNPDSEYTGKVMDAMMQYFLDSMMEPADDAVLSLPADDDEEEGSTRPDQLGRSGEVLYQIKRSKLRASYAQKDQSVRLDAGLAVRRRFQTVGNMSSWYASLRGNKCCIQSVNLSDPFFKQREIRFILDQDAVDIFKDMVNYVTINVKKKRSKGKEFNDSATIDANYLDKNGIVASMTYAREDDRNSELYEYQTQWSVRGGNLFPASPRWLQGNWEGVTLAPPIEPWFVEVEGDLAQMEDNDISRVTVELHYPLFGKEEFKVIALSPRAGEDLVGQKIYVDRGTRGFAYRLIIHHKSEGRLVLPWQTRIGDRYVYATIPEEILAAGKPREEAKLAAQKLGKIGSDKVLDQYQELFAEAD